MKATNQEYVAVGYDTAGNIKAFTTGDKAICDEAAKAYRRAKKGSRAYPVVHVMPRDEWDTIAR